MGNKIIKTAVTIVLSFVATILIFLLLTYSGIATRIMDMVMSVLGLNSSEEWSGGKYAFYFIIGLLAFIFIITYLISVRFIFRKRK